MSILSNPARGDTCVISTLHSKAVWSRSSMAQTRQNNHGKIPFEEMSTGEKSTRQKKGRLFHMGRMERCVKYPVYLFDRK
jgi:hypothetical protein